MPAEYDNEFLGADEATEANDPNVGDGSPETAPELHPDEKGSAAMKRGFLARLLGLTALSMLLLPAAAFAEDTVPPLDHTLLLTSTQFYAMLIASFVPAVTYVFNHYGPQTSEPVKATVLAVVAAAAGALAQLLDAGSLAFDTNTLQTVAFAVAAAFAAHLGFWRPSALSAKLGGGTNAQDGNAVNNNPNV